MAGLLESGADDYLGEPRSREDLQLRLQVLEHRMRSNGGEPRALDRRLTDSQKIDTLAALAGTLAHDFNNILAAILGNAELAMLDLTPNSSTRYSLEQIDKASRRAAEITRQMLTYTGRSETALRPVQLTQLVREMAELLRASVSKRCRMEFEFQEDLPPVLGDAGQLRQVVMNLLLNASDAIGAEGGTVRLRTGLVYQEEEQRVCLEVQDNGSGMAPETLARIFEPFFTTKRSGRGLGLAAVHSIVHAHHGTITVDSELKRGSTFRLLFPAATHGQVIIPPEQELPDWKGTGNILLIDDEDAVREVAQRLLRKAGFHVYEAASGDEGAEMFCRHAHELHAVILDLNMPGLDGFEVYEVIRKVRPETKVIVWSGFDEAVARERLRGIGDPVILEKPSSARELAAALERVLTRENRVSREVVS